MVDYTVVNSQVRRHLDSLGYENVVLDMPHYDDRNWYVNVLDDWTLIGVVVLTPEGEVVEDLSFPTVTVDSLDF